MEQIKTVLNYINQEVLICEKLGILTKETLLALTEALKQAIKAA